MSVLRLIAVALLLAIASAVPSHSQQPHWLVGTWKGSLSGLGNVPYGTERTLTVTAVAPDGGSANGLWEGPSSKLAAKITITGEDIVFVVSGSGGATYKMTHKGTKLDGTWTANGTGKSGPISMTKQ